MKRKNIPYEIQVDAEGMYEHGEVVLIDEHQEDSQELPSDFEDMLYEELKEKERECCEKEIEQ